MSIRYNQHFLFHQSLVSVCVVYLKNLVTHKMLCLSFLFLKPVTFHLSCLFPRIMHGPTAMDLPNKGLVQDGTKCGDERICLHKQCMSFMELKRPPCPGEKTGVPCSGNGVSKKICFDFYCFQYIYIYIYIK